MSGVRPDGIKLIALAFAGVLQLIDHGPLNTWREYARRFGHVFPVALCHPGIGRPDVGSATGVSPGTVGHPRAVGVVGEKIDRHLSPCQGRADVVGGLFVNEQ